MFTKNRRPRATYIDTLKRDTGAKETVELVATLMADRKVWHGRMVGRLLPTK